MRRTTRWLTLAAIAGALVATPALAAQHGGSTKHTVVTAHGPKTTTTTTKAPAPKSPRVKATTTKSKAQTSTAKGGTAKSPKTQASASKGTTTKSAAPTTTTATGSTASGSSGSTSGGTTTGTGTSAGTWTPNNPVAEKLSTKTNLLNKVQGSLPAGTDLNAATAGFKNFGQFVAAVNVSNNLGIPFADLKTAMTGTALDGTKSGTSPVSLGQAIQQLKPGVNAEAEARTAEAQANQQITGTSTTSTTTTTKKKAKSPKHPGGTGGGSF